MASLNLSTLRAQGSLRLRNAHLTSANWASFANNAQDEIAQNIPFEHLWHDESFTTTSARKTYYLPRFLPNQVVIITDETNQAEIYPKSEQDLIHMDISRDDSGSPSYYSQTGLSTWEGQPTSASTITIVSSSASDTTQKVRIRGLVSSAENQELLTLNGTTSVAGTLSFSKILQISKDATTAGKVTVTATTGGTTLAVIPTNRLSQEYVIINFHPVPSSTLTMRAYGYRRPMDMVNDQDLPELPEMFHELIEIGMMYRAHRFLYDFNTANQMQAIFMNGVEVFKRSQGKKTGYSPKMAGRPALNWKKDFGTLPPEFG